MNVYKSLYTITILFNDLLHWLLTVFGLGWFKSYLKNRISYFYVGCGEYWSSSSKLHCGFSETEVLVIGADVVTLKSQRNLVLTPTI